MKAARRFSPLACFALAAAVLYAGGSAATVYKTVDKDGKVTFSDTPIDGAVAMNRIDLSDSGKPADAPNVPMYLALSDSFDEAVAQANAKLDMAEHALALARGASNEYDPLSLANPRHTRADAQRLEFYKRDLLLARRDLMRVLKQRNTMVAFQKPLA